MLKIPLALMSHPSAVSSTQFPECGLVLKGGRRADIFVILLITCVNGQGADQSLSGLASRAGAADTS